MLPQCGQQANSQQFLHNVRIIRNTILYSRTVCGRSNHGSVQDAHAETGNVRRANSYRRFRVDGTACIHASNIQWLIWRSKDTVHDPCGCVYTIRVCAKRIVANIFRG